LECVTLTPSGAGVLIAVLTPGTGAGPGRVDFPFGMTPEVLLLELRGAVTVFTQRIRCTVQEGAVAGRVEVLQLAEQVCLCKILGGYTWHVVLLWPDTVRHTGQPVPAQVRVHRRVLQFVLRPRLLGLKRRSACWVT
jgi:hypothetical protein